MVCFGSGDDTPQSCTSAIPEMDFAFGSKNPTDVSQLAPLGVGVSNARFCLQPSISSDTRTLDS